jgi:hypothetical protein
MPQTAQQANIAVTPAPGAHAAPLQLDQSGNLLTGSGSLNKLNITANTLVKSSAGRVCKLIFNAASTSAPAVYDFNAVTGFAAANLVWVGGTTTAAQTVVALDVPCLSGIVVVPGGATVAVSFD